jgi:casein kinase II subunit alpha
LICSSHLHICGYAQLAKIVSVLGTIDFIRFMKKYRLGMTPSIQLLLDKYVKKKRRKRRSWLTFMPPGCPMPSRAGLRLMDSLLVYDPGKRLTAQQAMRHAFFDEVRSRVATDLAQRKLL